MAPITQVGAAVRAVAADQTETAAAVPVEHEILAEQPHRLLAVDERRRRLAAHDGAQERGLHVRGLVDARRHAVADQVDEEGLFAGGGILEQLDELCRPLGVQRLRRDALGGAFGGVGLLLDAEGDDAYGASGIRLVMIRSSLSKSGYSIQK